MYSSKAAAVVYFDFIRFIGEINEQAHNFQIHHHG